MIIRVLVVDGYPVVRAGIRRFLQAPDVVVAGEAGTGAAAVSTAAQLGPDVSNTIPNVTGLLTYQIVLAYPTSTGGAYSTRWN